MPLGQTDKNNDLREVYIPARVLNLCLPGWEQADDDDVTAAVAEAMEHAYWHWHWLMSIRQNNCRLIVVQHKDASGKDMMPHYQIGELFTLSQWHPERAVAEAQSFLAEGEEGLAFDLPVDEALLDEWDALADSMGLDDSEFDERTIFDVLISSMILLDDAHDRYVGELGDNFYIATRGLRRDIDRLLRDEFGAWSAETYQVTDSSATVTETYLFPEGADGVQAMNRPVPLVYPPAHEPLADDEEDGVTVVEDRVWNGPLN